MSELPKSSGDPQEGIRFLRDEILKLTKGSTQHLTNLHASLFYHCLKARHFEAAMPFFKINVSDLFLAASPIESSVSNCDASDEVAGLKKQTKPGLQIRSVLLYFYYGSMILCALERYEEAILMLEHVICLPAIRLSAIVLESLKKYILVSLILGVANPVASLPAYKSSFVARDAMILSVTYIQLSKLCKKMIEKKKDVAAAIESFLESNRTVFDKDHNVGLVKRLIISRKEHAVKRLGNIFISLSMEDAAYLSFNKNFEETGEIIRRLCDRNELSARCDVDTQTIYFYPVDKPPIGQQQLDEAIAETIELSNSLQVLDDAARVHPKYVERLMKSTASGPKNEEDIIEDAYDSTA